MPYQISLRAISLIFASWFGMIHSNCWMVRVYGIIQFLCWNITGIDAISIDKIYIPVWSLSCGIWPLSCEMHEGIGESPFLAQPFDGVRLSIVVLIAIFQRLIDIYIQKMAWPICCNSEIFLLRHLIASHLGQNDLFGVCPARREKHSWYREISRQFQSLFWLQYMQQWTKIFF